MPGLANGIYGITNYEPDRRNNAALLNDNDCEDIRRLSYWKRDLHGRREGEALELN